jgi:hypothetical protein
MKTLHNTTNCKYRRHLNTLQKQGKISGKFYKFICRNYPYNLNYAVKKIVSLVLSGELNEGKAIHKLKGEQKEIKRQKDMMRSNLECREKISSYN